MNAPPPNSSSRGSHHTALGTSNRVADRVKVTTSPTPNPAGRNLAARCQRLTGSWRRQIDSSRPASTTTVMPTMINPKMP